MPTVPLSERLELARSLVNAAQAMDAAYCGDVGKADWCCHQQLGVYPLRSSDGYGMIVITMPESGPPDEEPFVREVVAKVSLKGQKDWARVYLVHKLLMALEMLSDEGAACERR